MCADANHQIKRAASDYEITLEKMYYISSRWVHTTQNHLNIFVHFLAKKNQPNLYDTYAHIWSRRRWYLLRLSRLSCCRCWNWWWYWCCWCTVIGGRYCCKSMICFTRTGYDILECRCAWCLWRLRWNDSYALTQFFQTICNKIARVDLMNQQNLWNKMNKNI